MRHCDKDEVRHLQYVLMPGDKATFLDYAEQRGIDFAKYPMEVELSEIELGGMLVTSDTFESTVPGLYNGCVFYSFSGSMCSGYIAAIEGCKVLSNIQERLPVNQSEVDSEIEQIFKPMKRTGEGIDYRRFELAIRQVMTYYMGFERNQKGMETALERLNFIETYLDKLQAKDFRELMRTNESIHLLKTCQLATKVTMERKETGRAIYRRSDYPDLNPEYAKTLAVWQEGGEPCIAWL
jgi:succinate dehydrogenase/fumarate reductase flavoprotein subunit